MKKLTERQVRSWHWNRLVNEWYDLQRLVGHFGVEDWRDLPPFYRWNAEVLYNEINSRGQTAFDY